jgi:hypothetical protein
MNMKDGLTGILACVDPNVEARHATILQQDFLALLAQHGLNSIKLGLVEVEVVSHMPLRDYERMQGSYRETVPDCVAEFILVHDPVGLKATKTAAVFPIFV